MAEKLIKIRYDVETVDVEKADAIFKRIAASTEKADKELREFSKDSKKAGNDASGAFKKTNQEADKLNKNLKGAEKGFVSLSNVGVRAGARIGTSLAAAFSVAALVGIGKKMLDVTAEFQKFEAVLTNTLGSNSAAQGALLQIQDFAAKTPFSVSELTESYVKLANAGIKPTVNQLRQLGDLAASTGKGFDQLTEAIIDAQTGEFERLKEFGVRAQKEGDKVKFTFKGVQTQVDFTSASITKYITGLGDLKGVSGAMASISGTLGGQISNLGDGFEQLFLTLGRSSGGVMSTVIQGLSNIVQGITDIIKGQRQLIKESLSIKVEDIISGKTVDELKQINKRAYEDLNEAQEKYYKLQNDLIKEQKNTLVIGTGAMGQTVKSNAAELGIIEGQIERQRQKIEGYQQAYKRTSEEIAKAQEEAARKSEEAAAKETGILIKLRAQLKEAQEARENATTTKDINIQNARIKNIQAEIDRLLGVEKQAAKTRIELEKLAGIDYLSGLTEFGQNLKGALGQIYEKLYEEQVSGAGKATEANEKQSEAFINNISDQINARANQFNLERERFAQQEREEQERLERRKELIQEFTTTTQDLYGSIVAYQNQLDDQRLNRLEANRERDLLLAGENTKERARIELEFDSKIKAIRRKQAEREKRLAIFNAIINTAQGVSKAIAQGGVAGIILGALVAAAGAVQIAAISNQEIPAYAKGTKSVPGRGNKDSEHAMLTPGEMVIPVATKKKYSPILNKIFDNKIDPQILNNIANGKSGGAQVFVNDNKEVVEALKKLEVQKFSFDENGFTRYQEKGSSRTKYLEKRYSSK